MAWLGFWDVSGTSNGKSLLDSERQKSQGVHSSSRLEVIGMITIGLKTNYKDDGFDGMSLSLYFLDRNVFRLIAHECEREYGMI